MPAIWRATSSESMRRSTWEAPRRSASSSAASTALHSATLLVRIPRKVASSARVSPVSASRRMAPSPAGPGLPRAAPSVWIRRRRCGRRLVVAASGTLGLLDLLGHLEDGARHVDPTGTGLDAVEDRPATPHPIGVGHQLQALLMGGVAAVEDEPMRVDDRGRTNVVGIGPEDRAGGGARRAQDAARGVLVPLPVRGRLVAFLAVLRDLVVDQVWHGGPVLRPEVLHLHQQVLDDRDTPQRLDADLPASVLDQVLAGEPVAAIDEHGIGAAYAMRA